MTWLGYRTFVAPDSVAFWILTDNNPIFCLLRLALCLVRFLGPKLHPRFAIVCFLLNELQLRRRGVGTKRVMDESEHAQKRRLFARRLLLPSFTPVKACPHLVLNCDFTDGVPIFRLDGQIEISTSQQPMDVELER